MIIHELRTIPLKGPQRHSGYSRWLTLTIMTGADGSKLSGSLGRHQFCLPRQVARLVDRPGVSGTANDDKGKGG
jgi:hypothetical protein